ncbi:MAG: two-component system C4-dicarboxylate transport sensor histidine kinase DctB [Reinekea sp.]
MVFLDYIKKKKMTDATDLLSSAKAQYWQRHSSTWILAFTLCMLSLAMLYQFGYLRALQRLTVTTEQDVNHQLELQVQILESHLEKYRLLPVLMGQHGDKSSWKDSDPASNATQLWLRQLNYLSGSFDTLILSTQGEIIASAQDLNKRFYNSSLLRALTVAPKEGRLGRQYFNIDENHSLYAFSSFIQANAEPIGILVFMVNLEPVAQSWAIATAKLIATDDKQRVVLASNAALIGTTLIESKQLKRKTNQVVSSVQLNTVGWTVTAHASIDNKSIARLTILTALLVCLIIISIFTLFVRRREKLILIQQKDLLHAQELEQKILVRTSELQQTNKLLSQEVNDRRMAEEQLKTTQQELIQSAKMAAIGQMSTTLSHEYNQPLATMRTYAENGIKFLALNKIDSVADNLDRIIQQTDRLGNLSRILMSFARKPSDQSDNINIHSCVEESFMLVRPRVKAASLSLSHNIAETDTAYGNSVQISQVILNLLTNAIDAINDSDLVNQSHRVMVSYQRNTHYVSISIEDSGPGVSLENQIHIFEPFYTSKQAGAGLGLGLPIVKDIMKEHRGNIYLTQSSLGGACFTIELPNKPNKSKTPT